MACKIPRPPELTAIVVSKACNPPPGPRLLRVAVVQEGEAVAVVVPEVAVEAAVEAAVVVVMAAAAVGINF